MVSTKNLFMRLGGSVVGSNQVGQIELHRNQSNLVPAVKISFADQEFDDLNQRRTTESSEDNSLDEVRASIWILLDWISLDWLIWLLGIIRLWLDRLV